MESSHQIGMIVDELRGIAGRLEMLANEISAIGAPKPEPTPECWLEFPLPIGRSIKITGEFGEIYTIGGRTWTHEGIDFSVPVGIPVMACAGGTVVVAGDRGGYGTCVRIEHQYGGIKWWTWYGHLSKLLCAVGNYVVASQLIGMSGNTGNVTGAHLHLSVQRGDDTTLLPGLEKSPILRGCVDPRPLLKWPA